MNWYNEIKIQLDRLNIAYQLTGECQKEDGITINALKGDWLAKGLGVKDIAMDVDPDFFIIGLDLVSSKLSIKNDIFNEAINLKDDGKIYIYGSEGRIAIDGGKCNIAVGKEGIAIQKIKKTLFKGWF